MNNNHSFGSNDGFNETIDNISFSNKANSLDEKKVLLDNNNLNNENEFNLNIQSINDNE